MMDVLLDTAKGRMDEILDRVKGRMDEVLDQVKGQHVEKVNELEEKIKRLQMYNEDLRSRLVKEISNSRKNRGTTTTPPDVDIEEDKNADEDQDSDSASDMEPASFLTNVLVMDNIFVYLDVKELKECRLICKDWNKAITSILSKRNNGNGLTVNLAIEVHWKWNDENAEECVDDDDLKNARGIHSIVEAAPNDWFRIINLSDNLWTRDAYKSVFQDFGNRLKVIKVTSESLHIQTLRSILLDWCPNLEELKLKDIKFGADRELKISGESRPLKLTGLSFSLNDIDESTMPFEDVAQVLFTIIRNSPDLKKLELLRFCTTVGKKVFSKLQNHPQIMSNMEEICLSNASWLIEIGYPLEELTNIQFESKLKNLFLTDIGPGQSIGLNRILNMTNKSLEKLAIKSHSNHSVEGLHFELDLLEQMDCLREFRYHADGEWLINSIDILAKMPNLKVFEFGFESHFSYSCHQSDFIDWIFFKSRQLMRNPHQNLKELRLFGIIGHPNVPFDVINRGLPNLNKLVVGIDRRKNSNFYYNQFFEGISKLENLTNLCLHLNNLKCFSNFSNAFLKLKDLPKLMQLTMQDAEIQFDEASFIALPKLRRLTFIGITMSVDKAKRLLQLLKERSIFLDIKEH